MSNPDTISSCSFCLKKKEEVANLIAGDNAGICNECVDLCIDKLRQATDGAAAGAGAGKAGKTSTPAAIKRELDDYVIGHERVKKNARCRRL